MQSDLLKLVAENPELEVIAWVESEIVGGDDYSRWCGKLGKAHIQEYIEAEMYNDYPEFVYKDDTEDLENYLYDMEMSDEEIAAYINNIEWKKAIFVNVDLL